MVADTQPPVTPDAETARRLLEQELAKPEYHGGPSLLDRFLNWLNDLFSDVPELGISRVWASVAIVGAVVIAVVIAFVVAGPVRRRAVETRKYVLATDDTRTAAQCRRAADAAAAAGDWALAVVERFRAIARSLEERAIVDERPGRTAHELAHETAPQFDGLAVELTQAAMLFDEVCYGNRSAGPDDDAFLRAVDERLAAARRRPPASVDQMAAPA